MIEKGAPKMKMLSTWDKDDGNKVRMGGTKVYWCRYDVKYDPSWTKVILPTLSNIKASIMCEQVGKKNKMLSCIVLAHFSTL
jgi:hypothetical protein